MRTKLVGFFTIFALICGDCMGYKKEEISSNDVLLNQNITEEYLIWIDILKSECDQLRKQVRTLKKQIEQQQAIIKEYESSEIYYDANESIKIPKTEYSSWIRAAAEGDISTIQSYINKGYDVNTLYDLTISLPDGVTLITGSNALTVAAEYNQEEVVKLLLANGANANLANIRGITPLMNASANGHENIVKLLLDNGADVNAKSHNGLTALDLAETNKRKKVVQQLRANGAKDTEFLKQQSHIDGYRTSSNPKIPSLNTRRANELITSSSKILPTTAKVLTSEVAAAAGKAVVSQIASASAKRYRNKQQSDKVLKKSTKFTKN